MKKTHTFEIVGLGEFSEVTAKAKETEYPECNKLGVPIFKKILTANIPAEFVYVDKDNNTYTKDEKYYNINGKIVQKINRTERVSKFELVPISETNDILDSISNSFCSLSDTTAKIFKEKVHCDSLIGQAVKFTYKKSSVGTKFYKTYIWFDGKRFCMRSGVGKYSEACEEFDSKFGSQAKESNSDSVEVSADELDPVVN